MHSINSKKNNMKVGYTIFFGLLILFLFVVIVGTRDNLFSKTYTLNLVVKETVGLKKGGSVLLGGLKVGSIKDIRFVPVDNKSQIVIELSLLQEYAGKITTGSSATIETFGLLGDKMINISLGNINENPLSHGDILKVEESFSIETAGSVVEPILQKIDSIASDINNITGNVSSGNGTLGKLLVDDSAINKLNVLLENISGIVSSVNSSKGSIGKLINEPNLYNDLTSITFNLKTITDSLASGKGTLGKFLTDSSFYTNLNELTSRLRTIVKKTEKDSTLIGGFLNDKTLYIKFNSLIDELNSLIIDIKENPDRYINVSVF